MIKELPEEVIEKNYARYVKWLKGYISRDGIDKFIEWLEGTDAKEAPASTKYYLSCKGGLVMHSLNVMKRLIKLMGNEYGEDCPYTKESIAIVALLHDVSKLNYYKVQWRNVRNNETGQWEQVPQYVTVDKDNRLLFGNHADNSLYILNKFFDLSYDEQLAIKYHHGGMDYSDSDADRQVMWDVYKKCPLAFFLNEADTQAVILDEDAPEELIHNLDELVLGIENDENTERTDSKASE